MYGLGGAPYSIDMCVISGDAFGVPPWCIINSEPSPIIDIGWPDITGSNGWPAYAVAAAIYAAAEG
jgi:hypothetical protein